MNVPTMAREIRVRHAARPGYVALSLPYKESDAGTFVPFVRALDAGQIERVTRELRERVFNVFLPKFEVQTSFPLEQELARAGMTRVFDPFAAEFPLFATRAPSHPKAGASCPESNIHVGQFLHKARVILDEDGTVAAAATALSLDNLVSAAPPPLEIKVDRPFVFFIRDASGAVLFVGHVLDPR